MMVMKALVLSLVHPQCACLNSSSPEFRTLNVAPFHFRRHWSIRTPITTCCLKSDSNKRNARWKGSDSGYERRNEKLRDDGEGGNNGTGSWKRRKRKQKWSSDEARDEIDETASPPGNLDEVIESIWIFKAFKSYGYMLPVIIFSLFIATGPKAFLASLGVAVMPSVLYLAVQKIVGKGKTKQRRRAKTGRRVPTGAVNNVEEGEGRRQSRVTRKRQPRPQSWVGSNNVPVNHYGQGTQDFGGWDDLVEQPVMEPLEEMKPSQKTSPSNQRHMSGERDRRESGMPLLLRLLVAVFPVLGPWTKMLW